MMTLKILLAPLAGIAIFLTATAHAQWLNPHLDAQRWNNLRKHQQNQRKQAYARQNQGEPRSAASGPLTLAERQAAWSRNRAEYRRRLLNDGKASADRWLDGVARANR